MGLRVNAGSHRNADGQTHSNTGGHVNPEAHCYRSADGNSRCNAYSCAHTNAYAHEY